MKPEFPNSSAIRYYQYDEVACTIDVEYAHGGIYRYLGVPESEYEELQEAISKGTFINQKIKRHPFLVIRKRSA